MGAAREPLRGDHQVVAAGQRECRLASGASVGPDGQVKSASPAIAAGPADVHPPETTADVRLIELTKRFRETVAVDAISLEIRIGEFFSLLGPSGCGKTTTLRMIGGFELPTSGRIELRGRDVTMEPPEKRPVNMVFQSYALFPHLSVFDNVAFGLRRRKVPGVDVHRRVGAALELVRLTGYDRRGPGELSGGQQQRVALARALVCEPTVLLLDEPLGALDLKLRRQLQVELKRVQVEVGITFVYVTHDQEEALALSDRIAVMKGGQIEQLGTPEELYDRPRTRFVADFIGTTNLLAGTVESVAGGQAVIALAGASRCIVPAGSLSIGRPVEVAVRPEALALAVVPADGAGDAGDAAASWLRGTVEQSAYLGTSISYQVRTEGGQRVVASVPHTQGRYAAGTAVVVRWHPVDALVLEDPTTSGDGDKEDAR